MYPNLYYVFKDWFGVNWKGLSFLNTFGLMVAIAFMAAAFVLSSELKRKEKQGLLLPKEESIIVGKPASIMDLFLNFIGGFLFAYKIVGLFFNKPEDVNAQEYIFSREGNLLAGLALGGVLAFLKWNEKNKQKLKEPQQRTVRIWPHDRIGDIIVLGLIFGILGAKLFDGLENWDEFVKDPIGIIFSPAGLTFYGGLIVAAIAIIWYARKNGITLIHLMDAVAPALILAYGIGRIGCQVAGDGDWGIYNSAYVTDPVTYKSVPSTQNEFKNQLVKYNTYFLNGSVLDSGAAIPVRVTDRVYENLDKVPHRSFKAPSFLPVWMVAYNYPNNVNKDGIKIYGCEEEHCRVLPTPVFPTPFYETIACVLLFLFLWAIRKSISTPGILFSIYLIVNGLERFVVEKIRVNYHYQKFGFHVSQAEIISFSLIIIGIIMFIYLKIKNKTPQLD
ncbi:prolipoprotein diacylglyceryl transferase [Ferruginibacter albus]|uniref:prolipoprotein diacylglyceryl transferase n=1 Tax=Ferruginibacter albus TaxID=2875540 RepID=UPI001CC5A9A9|nr:prolipoprotein diacylglyceryl transferase family protein [Ferruginibacter albus]UAY51165.1 prolipoprotein diacylglyceryl transferase [Ferruginibacter albus]